MSKNLCSTLDYKTAFARILTEIQLFYNKRSQFLSGVEAEKVPVSVGQRVSTLFVQMEALPV